MNNETMTIEVANGNRRAVFIRDEEGWKPDWMYEDDRPMLRFKDHEWLSIGHVHPSAAGEAERLRGGGAVFRGVSKYGAVDVPWSVTIKPDKPSGGFTVECVFQPAETLELLEAYTTFETPYDYDGNETVTTVIGQNPVEKWIGPQHYTPPQWRHAVWSYSRPEAVRITGPCNIPLLCQAIEQPGNSRFTTIIGDWRACKVRDVYVTPTRSVSRYKDDWAENKSDSLRGYKFIVGALNWSSAFTKDPNVLFSGGAKHRQRVVISFSSTLPGGSLDQMLYAAWERAAAVDFPAKARVQAYDRTVDRGVTWQSALKWLRDTFCGDGVDGLYLADKGITTYAKGSRPKAGGDYSWGWWPQWAAGFRYRSMMFGDAELAATCDRLDKLTLEQRGRLNVLGGLSNLPSIWYVHSTGHEGPLAELVAQMVQGTYEASVKENGTDRKMDYGGQSTDAETLLLGAQRFNRPEYLEQALLLLKEVNSQLDDRFWWFGNTNRESMFHGGQIRPMGHGHAAAANWLAWRATGREEYRDAARRFARYMLAINYVTHNNSGDPDFDWRGWANGTIAGRDQYAEFPPWETSNSLIAVAAMMDDFDLEGGFHDALWYFARTGLAQFPAARTVKRILDESMNAHFIPRNKIASERDFYDILPYLAYENPHDQTLLASYQGTDCLVGEMLFGNGLARSDDDRLGVLVPAAARFDQSAATRRTVHVWNPTAREIESRVSVNWPDGTTAGRPVSVPKRSSVKLTFEK